MVARKRYTFQLFRQRHRSAAQFNRYSYCIGSGSQYARKQVLDLTPKRTGLLTRCLPSYILMYIHAHRIFTLMPLEPHREN